LFKKQNKGDALGVSVSDHLTLNTPLTFVTSLSPIEVQQQIYDSVVNPRQYSNPRQRSKEKAAGMGNERCLHDSREKETPDDEKFFQRQW
jgi:hypothetical protein